MKARFVERLKKITDAQLDASAKAKVVDISLSEFDRFGGQVRSKHLYASIRMRHGHSQIATTRAGVDHRRLPPLGEHMVQQRVDRGPGQKLRFPTWDQCLRAGKQLEPHEALTPTQMGQGNTRNALLDQTLQRCLHVGREGSQRLFDGCVGRQRSARSQMPQASQSRIRSLLRLVWKCLQCVLDPPKKAGVQIKTTSSDALRLGCIHGLHRS